MSPLVVAPDEPGSPPGLDDAQQLRYSRHLLLNDWDEACQQRLLAAHALVVGAGGLGAPALMYLAAAGVGRITVIDPDEVELSNLQRQVVHQTARIGWPKVASARQALAEINPEVTVQAVHRAADAAWLAEHLPGCQVVLDCTDRFDTRHAINRAAVRAGVPVVSAAALGWDAQLTVFDPRQPEAPCYACLFPPDAAPVEARCALMGVFAPLVGTLGVMQAGEAIKLLTGLDAAPGQRSLAGRLLMLDGRQWRWTELQARRRADCPVCGPPPHARVHN